MRITLTGVTVQYGDTTAVDDLTLNVDDGEMIVLLGPSGCGKTTAMRAIAGLETPTCGRITIGDDTVFDADTRVDVPINARGVGMVFQSYAIWPHKSVLDNVVFPLKVKGGMTRREMRAAGERILESVGLAGFADRGASMLSGGQMQRVALARSLAMSPRVLLLDEPLSNLDAKLRDRLRFELKEMQERLGITAVYVTHDINEALALADRLIVMRDGRIVQLGDPEQIYTTPNCAFVADFLGITNLFESEVSPAVAGAKSGSATQAGMGSVTVCFADGASAVSTSVGVLDGPRAMTCIRPEDVQVTATPPGGSSANVWRGTVAVSSFLGSQLRYKIRVSDGLAFDVIDPNLDHRIRVGDTAYLQVRPDRVMVLPHDVERTDG